MTFLCSTDQPPFHPFLHPPRIWSRYFHLEHQKQVHLQTSRIRPRQVLRPIKLQHKQTFEYPEGQCHNGYVGQEQRLRQRSLERQADPGPIQQQVPVPVGLLERGTFHRRIQTVRFLPVSPHPH